MKHIVITATLVVGVLAPSVAYGQLLDPSSHPGCDHLVSVKQDLHAAQMIYAGTRKVTLRNLRKLGFMERCQRNPTDHLFVRSYNRRLDVLHKQRIMVAAVPWNGPVTASWFDDSGATACGFHATYGFATLLGIPCGKTVEMQGPSGAIVHATREDSGPYVSGRTFDLNPSLKAALECGDLCTIRWR